MGKRDWVTMGSMMALLLCWFFAEWSRNRSIRFRQQLRLSEWQSLADQVARLKTKLPTGEAPARGQNLAMLAEVNRLQTQMAKVQLDVTLAGLEERSKARLPDLLTLILLMTILGQTRAFQKRLPPQASP